MEKWRPKLPYHRHHDQELQQFKRRSMAVAERVKKKNPCSTEEVVRQKNYRRNISFHLFSLMKTLMVDSVIIMNYIEAYKSHTNIS